MKIKNTEDYETMFVLADIQPVMVKNTLKIVIN